MNLQGWEMSGLPAPPKGAGQRLGVGEVEDVRIEVGELVHVEETQGEPQTKKVWGSPAPERERERKRKKESTRRRRTNHTRKRRRQANRNQTRVGS